MTQSECLMILGREFATTAEGKRWLKEFIPICHACQEVPLPYSSRSLEGTNPSQCLMIVLGLWACAVMVRTQRQVSSSLWFLGSQKQVSHQKKSIFFWLYIKVQRNSLDVTIWYHLNAFDEFVFSCSAAVQDTIGSQFYITLRELPFLDGKKLGRRKIVSRFGHLGTWPIGTNWWMVFSRMLEDV